MKIKIKGTNVIKELNVFDDKTRENRTFTLLANAGALNDDTFLYDEKTDAFEVDAGMFDYWSSYVIDYAFDSDDINDFIKEIQNTFEYKKALEIELSFLHDVARVVIYDDYNAYHAVKQDTLNRYRKRYLNAQHT